MFRDAWRDVRIAGRSLVTAPGFALGVIASLTLGIVANTAAFSFVNAAVFRPFPGVRDQHELVRVEVGRQERFGRNTSTTYEEYELLGTGLTTVELAAHHRVEFAVTVHGASTTRAGALVTGNYFDVLGVRPAAGRFLTQAESRTPHPVAVISHNAWRQIFNEDPSALGQSILVNGTSVEIVGVAPPRFYGVVKGHYDTDIWLPVSMGHVALRDAQRRQAPIRSAGYLALTYVGRRTAGASVAAIEAQAAVAAQHVNTLRPADKQGTRISVSRVWLNDPVKIAPAIATFLAVPLLVLVIACVNAANLLLARSSRQGRDWRVRLALGASKWRVVRQVLVESLVLAAISAAGGLVLTAWVLGLVEQAIPVPVPLDLRVMLFTVAAAGATALAFGLGPALHVASRAAADPRGLSRMAAGASRSRVRFTLIALQAALSLGLLATGAQFVKTVRTGYASDRTTEPDRLLIASFNVDALNMPREAADDFYARLLDATASLPGVIGSAMTTSRLLAGAFDVDSSARVWLPGDAPGGGRSRTASLVSSDYFRTVRVPLVQGRQFTSAEHAGPVEAVIVNRSFAKRYFAANALNRTMRLAPSTGTYADAVDATVVGVVGSELGRSDDDDPPMIYYAAPLTHTPARMLYVRFDGSGRFNLAALQGAVRKVDYRVPIRDAATLRERQAHRNAERKLVANGVAALGLFALTLAAGGLYGVVSYLVQLRLHEMGVRLALGASGRSVVILVLRQGLAPMVVGAVAGGGAAAAIGLVVRSRLYGATPVDPLAFGGAAALLLVTMIVASVVPARHAARVDPMMVLRQE